MHKMLSQILSAMSSWMCISARPNTLTLCLVSVRVRCRYLPGTKADEVSVLLWETCSKDSLGVCAAVLSSSRALSAGGQRCMRSLGAGMEN